MNPILIQLASSECPETPCSACRNAIWHTGNIHRKKTALSAFCRILGHQIYNGQSDGNAVQMCSYQELDD